MSGRFVAIAAVATGFTAFVTADDCDIGSYYDADSDSCKYCMNAPLDGYYTGNGNSTSMCPYEICEVCPTGQYNKGCGYDDQTRDPPSVCFQMTDYDDICSAGPKYCTVAPTTTADYADCDAYCSGQELNCLASYTSGDGGCSDDLAEGTCSAAMTTETVCACDLPATCADDPFDGKILDCQYYSDTEGNCPSEDNKDTSLEDQIFAAQHCRESCDACVTGADFASGGQCTACSQIDTTSLMTQYYTSGGDRSDSCDVADCSQDCFLGQYNAGCGANGGTQDTFACGLCKSTCGEGMYISDSCDGTGFQDDTVCSPCSGFCFIGQYVANTCDGTTTYDSTECVTCTASCNPGYYIDGEVCTGTETESAAVCTACTSECPEGQFPSGYCTGSSFSDDVQCHDCYTECNQDCDPSTGACDCFEPCFTTTVLGGTDNWALNSFDAVGGGESNQAGFLATDESGMGDEDEFNIVIGGTTNTAGGMFTSVTGGSGNIAFGKYNTLGAGAENVVGAASSGVWQIGVEGATVGGGNLNTASANYATVLGGVENTASAEYAGAIAGTENKATGDYSSILGGDQNSVRGSWAGVGGGKLNKAWANYATSPGGYLAKASARFSVVLGGSKNTAKGRYSFAAGFSATARKDYSGVLGFNGDTCKDNGSGTFSICADYVYVNGYDVTELLASSSGRRSRQLSDGTEITHEDGEMRRLARDMGYTLEPVELNQELNENTVMLKTIDEKLETASKVMQELEHLMEPGASLRSR